MMKKKNVVKKRGGGVMKKRGGGMVKKMSSGGIMVSPRKAMAMGKK